MWDELEEVRRSNRGEDCFSWKKTLYTSHHTSTFVHIPHKLNLRHFSLSYSRLRYCITNTNAAKYVLSLLLLSCLVLLSCCSKVGCGCRIHACRENIYSISFSNRMFSKHSFHCIVWVDLTKSVMPWDASDCTGSSSSFCWWLKRENKIKQEREKAKRKRERREWILLFHKSCACFGSSGTSSSTKKTLRFVVSLVWH